MSTRYICFYGEITKIIPKLSSNTLLIRFTAVLILPSNLYIPVFSETHSRKTQDISGKSVHSFELELFLCVPNDKKNPNRDI